MRRLIVAVFFIASAWSASLCAEAPAAPFKVSCAHRIDTPKGWIPATENALTEARDVIRKNTQWFQLVDRTENPHMQIEIMGTKIFSATYKYKQLFVVWMILKLGEFQYSYFGTGEYGAVGSAINDLARWVEKNYEAVRHRDFIPGGAKHLEFPFQLTEEQKVKTTPTGRRLKVFCTAVETPAQYRGTWEEGKEDAAKDIREKIQTRGKWIELTNRKVEADIVLEVLGRGYTMGQRHLVWTNIVVRGDTMYLNGYWVGKCIQCWRDAAGEVADRLDRLVSVAYDHFKAHSLAEGGVPVTEAPAPSPVAAPAAPEKPVSAPAAINSQTATPIDPVKPVTVRERPMTNQDVIDLVKGGLSEENTITAIKNSKSVDFDFSPDALKALLAAGVSNPIISAMSAKISRK